MVTFSKKLLTGGYFYGEHLRVKEAYRIYNTWMGDPTKLLLLEKAVEVIKRDGLIEQSREVGAEFQKRLGELQASSGGKLDQARGRGTFAAVDFPSGSLRDKFVDLVSRINSDKCQIQPSYIYILNFLNFNLILGHQQRTSLWRMWRPFTSFPSITRLHQKTFGSDFRSSRQDFEGIVIIFSFVFSLKLYPFYLLR